MKNNEADRDELFKESIRQKLEKRIEAEWDTEWKEFGKYTPIPNDRGSKFFETLAAQISKNSNNKLVGATVKRFVNNERSTKIENLDLICRYLGDASFDDFKQQNQVIGEQEPDYLDYFEVQLPFGKGNFQVRKRAVYIGAFLVVLLIFTAFSYQLTKQKQVLPQNITYLKLLHKSGKTSPAVYYLSVDLRGITYDSAYVSFNVAPEDRNNRDDQQRLFVKQPTDTLEYVVYKPQVIFAQLMVDGRNLGTIRLITYSNDWDGYYSTFLPETHGSWTDPLAVKAAFVQAGKLQYQRDFIQNPTHRGYFYANFLKVADFNINLTEADLLLNVRNAAKHGGISCFDVGIQVFDDIGNVFQYAPKRTGCPLNLVGFNNQELPLSFEQRDKLTQDFDEWTDINLRFKGNTVQIYIKNEFRTQLSLPASMGKLVEVKIDTKGTGEVNYLDFRDAEGRTYYEDFGEVLRD